MKQNLLSMQQINCNYNLEPHRSSRFELCGNFLATFHGHSDHSTKLLTRKFYYFVPGLKRSLRSRNDNQLSSPLSLTVLSFSMPRS